MTWRRAPAGATTAAPIVGSARPLASNVRLVVFFGAGVVPVMFLSRLSAARIGAPWPLEKE